MLPKWHILLGFIFSVLIYYLFNLSLLEASIVFLSSFLIDIDHYVWFIFKKKTFNLNKSYKWFIKKRKFFLALPINIRKKYKRSILFLHGIEFCLVIFFLSFIYNLFLFVLLGIIFHLLLDYIDIICTGEPLYAKISQVLVIIKNKNKKPNPFFNYIL